MTVEKKLEKKLREKIEEMGGRAIKLTSPMFTGLPDRLCLLPGGKVYFVELKSTGRRLGIRQGYVKALLEKLGFKVFVVSSDDELMYCLNWIKMSNHEV